MASTWGSPVEEIDFLRQVSDEDLRTEAEGLLTSYSHVWDVLAESSQNAVDAIEERYQESPDGWEPRLKFGFDYTECRIVITDNGRGMSQEEVRKAAAPFVTFKSQDSTSSSRRSRGQKGVGLTFLAMCCNHFEVLTCDGTTRCTARIEGAIDWVNGDSDKVPHLELSVDEAKPLDGEDRYTRVTLEDIQTADFSGGSLFDFSPDELIFLLRTKTSVGHTDPIIYESKPVPEVEVTVSFSGYDGDNPTNKDIPYRYFSPEELLADRFVYSADQVRKFKDRGEIKKAAGRAMVHRTTVTSRSGRDLNCYALVVAPKVFSDLSDDLGEKDMEKTQLRAGIYVATRGMPTGVPVESPKKGSGYWRRIFLLVQDNELNFDIGRKNLLGRAGPMMTEAAASVWDEIGDLVSELSPLPSEPTERKRFRRIETAISEAMEEYPNLDVEQLSYLKEPQKEQMVVGLFYELTGREIVKGYRTIRNNQWDVYDAFVKYEIDASLLGRRTRLEISEDRVEDFLKLEFKSDAEKILEDIQTNKKRWADIDLLVCWSLQEGGFEDLNITVREIHPGDVYYYGSTHELLFPPYLAPGRHRVTVMELEKVINELRQDEVIDSSMEGEGHASGNVQGAADE